MRKLTVTRRKYFAASWTPIYIYLSTDKVDFPAVNKSRHRLLGKLKNGQTITCEIPREEVTILAAYHSLGICATTDYATIPAGEQDVVLCGKTKLNPMAGNPFFFEKL